MLRRISIALAFSALALPSIALAEVPEELAIEFRPLIEEGLASDDVSVRSWAIRAAGLMDDDDLFEAITAELENLEAPVRIAAATALLEADEDEDAALELLATELAEGDAATRTLILERILPLAEVDQQVEVVEDAIGATTDTETLRQIVAFLAQRTSGDLHDVLCMAADEGAERRDVFVQAVQFASRPEGLAVAEALIDASDADAQLQGAEIAFEINTVEARELLAGLLDAGDAELAQRAGFHLARYGNQDALGLVKDLATNVDMDEASRMDALALIRDNAPELFSYAELVALTEEDLRSAAFITRVHELMGATGDAEAIAYLEGRLDALFADERLDGISGLGYTGDEQYIPALVEVMTAGGEPMLRARAIEGLGHLGGDAAAQALVDQIYAERDPAMQVELVRALGNTGSSIATQPILNQFATQDADLAMVALEALRELGDSTGSSQIEMVANTFRDPEVRWEAIITLTHLDSAIGRIRLLQALDRPPTGFREDINEFGEEIVSEVDEALLSHTDQMIRDTALYRILAQPDGGYSVLRPLLGGSLNPDVRRSAIAIVTATGNPDDAELFATLMDDGDRSLRLQGCAALANLGDAANVETLRGYLENADIALRMIAAYGVLKASQL